MKPPRRATVLRWLAAIASGLLLALSRPPFDYGGLALVALVPLFVAWRDVRPRTAAGLAFVAGAVYYAIACSWIWYFGAVAVVPFVGACAGYWAAAGAVVAWLRRYRVAAPWITAAVWVCADALVARWPVGGLSWGEIGYSFHDAAPARALASVGGVALVGYLAVVVNAVLADLLRPAARSQRIWTVAGVAVVAVAVVGATVTRTEPRPEATLRVALVQGNDKDRDLTAAEEDARYLPNSHFALAERITDPVDLIVFPESSMDADPRTDPFVHDRLAAIARKHHAWVLANATVDAPATASRPAGAKASNLDVLFAPDGTVAGTYAKRHLVPFGEYVPFRSFLQGLIPELEKVPRDFEPGKSPGIFTVDGTRIGTLICFESAFGYQVRPLVRDGAGVLVVSTNNRSYRRSGNSAQHVAIGQMRAAETGRPVLQAAISGITAVIDADGVVHERTKLFQNGVVQTTVAATTGTTPYVRFGEWVTFGAAIVVSIAVVIAFLRRRRRGSVDLSAEQDTVSIESRLVGYTGSEPPDAAELTPADAAAGAAVDAGRTDGGTSDPA